MSVSNSEQSHGAVSEHTFFPGNNPRALINTECSQKRAFYFGGGGKVRRQDGVSTLTIVFLNPTRCDTSGHQLECDLVALRAFIL